jgi:hypothetical protein
VTAGTWVGLGGWWGGWVGGGPLLSMLFSSSSNAVSKAMSHTISLMSRSHNSVPAL